MKKVLLLIFIFCGLVNSQDGYTSFEIESHIHNYESWLGNAPNPSGETHIAAITDSALTAFQPDAGNDDWGYWIQLLGSNDTPVRSGMLYFDAHRIFVTTAERATLYWIQVASDTTSINITTVGFYPTTTAVRAAPIDVMFDRLSTGSKLWARTKCPGQNTATINFYLGLHEYEK